MLRIAVVVGSLVTAGALSSGVALAEDVEGGRCKYGDASVNLAPSCDAGIGPDRVLEDSLAEYETEPRIIRPAYPRDLPSAPTPSRETSRSSRDDARGDVEGGHCNYGDASLNLGPSCDTGSSGGSPITNLTHPRTGQLYGQ